MHIVKRDEKGYYLEGDGSGAIGKVYQKNFAARVLTGLEPSKRPWGMHAVPNRSAR